MRDSFSTISKTDLHPKTSYFFTTVNIIKTFVGLGILAAPYGFMTCGYFLATILLLTNGIINCYTVNL